MSISPLETYPVETYQVWSTNSYKWIRHRDNLLGVGPDVHEHSLFFRITIGPTALTHYVSDCLLQKMLIEQVFTLECNEKQLKVRFTTTLGSYTRDRLFELMPQPNEAALTDPLANSDILSLILKQLEISDLAQTILVSRRWRDCSRSKSVWMDLLTRVPLHALYPKKTIAKFIPDSDWIKESVMNRKVLEGCFSVNKVLPLSLGEAAKDLREQGYLIENETLFLYVIITDREKPQTLDFNWAQWDADKNFSFVAPLALPENLILDALNGEEIEFVWKGKVLKLLYKFQDRTISKLGILKLILTKKSRSYSEKHLSPKHERYYKEVLYLPKA
jgi:hypothetical protein